MVSIESLCTNESDLIYQTYCCCSVSICYFQQVIFTVDQMHCFGSITNSIDFLADVYRLGDKNRVFIEMCLSMTRHDFRCPFFYNWNNEGDIIVADPSKPNEAQSDHGFSQWDWILALSKNSPMGNDTFTTTKNVSKSKKWFKILELSTSSVRLTDGSILRDFFDLKLLH